MATYIPQVTDYIPQLQPFKPDFNFYANALQTKQTQYDASYKQLSSAYGTLLYSPMLRDVNINRRDEYFKAADENIRKIAGLDLSKAENIESAMSVFKPFYEDKNMVKDMTWTKNLQREMGRGENFRNCVDPKKCGGSYWDGGIRALQYKADEFRNSSDEDALNFGSPRFVPFVNVTEKAMQAAKDAGFNIQVDEIKGGYIVTTKNGQMLEQPLYNYFTSLFGNDPAVMDVFRTQAYLQRKDFISTNTPQFGGADQAEQAYIAQVMNKTIPEQKKESASAKEGLESLLARKTAMDKKIQENGVLLNSDDHKAYFDLQQQIASAQGNNDFHEQAGNLAENATNLNNLQAMKGRIDDIVAYGLFTSQMQSAAKTFAFKDYSVSLQADPYALASHTSSLALKNALTLKEADFQYWKLKEEVKDQKLKAQATGGAEYNKPTMNPDAPGATTGTTTSSLNTNVEKRNELYGGLVTDERTYIRELAGTLQAEYLAAGQPGTKDGGTKRALLLETSRAIFKGTGLDPTKVLNGTEDLNKVDGWNTESTSGAYARAVKQSNPKEPVWGTTNDFWNQNFWEKTSGMREGIKNKDMIADGFDKFYKEQSQNAMAGLATKYEDQKDKNMVSLLADDNGRLREKDRFVRLYADKYANTYTPDPPTKASSYGHNPSYAPPGGNPDRPGKSSWEKAVEAANNQYDDLVQNYKSSYNEYAKPYDGLANFGNKGGGKTTMGIVYSVDPQYYESQSVLHASSIFSNYSQISSNPELQLKYGNAAEMGTDTGAKLVFDQLRTDFLTSQGSKKDKRPVFTIQYQAIAAANPNMTAVTIVPSEEWAAKYHGTKANPGLTYDGKYREGVTLFIPKNQANNTLYQATQYTDYDFLLDKTGKLDLNEYPGAGQITITKQATGYIATGLLKGYDAQGNPATETISESYQTALDPSVIYKDWNSKLQQLSQLNAQAAAMITNQYGIKNPAQLPSPQQ